MKNIEANHQKMFIKYLEMKKQSGKVIEYFAPVNENTSSFTNRAVALKVEAKAKAMGKKAGVSDVVVILKNKVLFIEMKRPAKRLKSGKLSTAGIIVSEYQKQFLENISQSEVCEGVVAYGFDEAKGFIDNQIKVYNGKIK